MLTFVIPVKDEERLFCFQNAGQKLQVTKEDICTVGYTKKVRDAPTAVKSQMYALYGFTSHEAGEYEVDRLMSLELGARPS